MKQIRNQPVSTKKEINDWYSQYEMDMLMLKVRRPNNSAVTDELLQRAIKHESQQSKYIAKSKHNWKKK